MSESSKYIGPEDEGAALEPGHEVIVPHSEDPNRRQTVFEVVESDEHEDLLAVEEVTDDEKLPKAKAYFRKGKKVTYELIPDHIKGEEGRRFLKIAGAVVAAAAAGTGTYIVIRRKNAKK